MEMIVVSFFAPRIDVWKCDYDALLSILQKSCDRLKLRHVVISDEKRKDFETKIFQLPQNLMLALLDGQRQFLESVNEPVLLVGADCVITKDPIEIFKKELVVTLGPFTDCIFNSGAIFCNDPKQCAFIWQHAIEYYKPQEWGEDQKALWKSIQESDIDYETIRCEEHNWAPDSVKDKCLLPDGSFPTVMHFRGTRKSWMKEWCNTHMHLGV